MTSGYDQSWRFNGRDFEAVDLSISRSDDVRDEDAVRNMLMESGYQLQAWFGEAGSIRIELFVGSQSPSPFLVRIATADAWWPIHTDTLPHALDLLARWVPLTRAAMEDLKQMQEQDARR